MKKYVLLLLLLTAVRARGVAQTSSTLNDDAQLWPDVIVGINLTPRVTLNLFGTARFGWNREKFVGEQLGTAVILRPSQYLNIAPSYRHIWSQPDELRQTQENRYFVDVTPRLPLPKGFTLSDRHRTELRDIEDKTSWRYRNRPQIEKAFTWHEHELTAYASVEFFFDSRFRQWNRKQYWGGLRVPASKHLTLDVHYSRVLDERARPGRLHILGLYSRFEF
jgi:hypothetical protein